MTLSERVAKCLGWTLKPFPLDDSAHDPAKLFWFDVDGKPRMFLPDPGSIEVVWQLRTLAIAKHPGEFCLRLCEETERDFYHGSPDYDIEALACATLEQVRDAALSVLEAKGGG